MSSNRINSPLFMIGMPRSGTTVISEAISLHIDLGWFSNYLGKAPFFPWLALLDRITNHPEYGWRLRGKKYQGKGLLNFYRRVLPHTDEAFSIWKRCCGDKFLWEYLIDQKASEKEKNCITSYIERVLQYQRKKIFFTKFTGPPRINYLKSIFPDSTFIHVVRDPRAVVSSLKKVGFWNAGKGMKEPWWKNGLSREDLLKWEDSGRSPAALAAVQWKKIVELAWEEKKFISPDRFIEIKYEDFVLNPHQVLSELFFSVRLTDSQEAHRYLDSIGSIKNMNYKFRNNLTKDEVTSIERIAVEPANVLGYNFS